MNHRYTNTNAIVQEFRAGNAEIFAIIFHQFYLEACFYAKRILDKPRIAEQIVEQTFIDLWKSYSQFDNWNSIKVFLYSNVRDACFGRIEMGQRGIREDGLSLYVWHEATQYMEKELSRPEVLKDIPYDPVANLPPLAKEMYSKLSGAGNNSQGIGSNPVIV
ncbi:MAG: RNA polymerase sigma factor [Pseudobacter sp.]|uniref:RNA polymerase sigma factor n=1 Tax=Pseudobacter sp. TaxID=2045420 RepID=UPI003F7DC2F8